MSQTETKLKELFQRARGAEQNQIPPFREMWNKVRGGEELRSAFATARGQEKSAPAFAGIKNGARQRRWLQTRPSFLRLALMPAFVATLALGFWLFHQSGKVANPPQVAMNLQTPSDQLLVMSSQMLSMQFPTDSLKRSSR